jgi:hypothetical protein
MGQVFFSVVCMHSADAPPVPFHAHIGGGGIGAESTLESIREWDNKNPLYTVGYEDNPNHIWKIVDHAFCEDISKPCLTSNHETKGYVILYYKPVDTASVIRDCLPELLEDLLEVREDENCFLPSSHRRL